MSDWPFVGEVPGNPIGKGRARGTAVGGYVRMYTPKKTADWESGAAMVLGAYWRRAPLEGCLEVEIMAMSARPKRLLRRKDPDGLMWKPSKPDSDNIEKSTWDALVKAGVIRDDCMVVLNRTWCCYAPRDRGPSVCVRVREAGACPSVGWWDFIPGPVYASYSEVDVESAGF